MPFLAVPDAEIVTGDDKEIHIGLIVNGTEPPSNTVIRATLVSVKVTRIFLKNLDGSAAYVTAEPLGQPETIEGVLYNTPWKVVFSKSQTSQLLSDPSDPTSKFVNEIEKNPGANGYGTGWLEIQIGSPFVNHTKHTVFTVKRGAIP